MNITARQLSGEHIGKKIKLGKTYATIRKVESNEQTVDVRAEILDSSLGPVMHFLSIPHDSTVTIQSDEVNVRIEVKGPAVLPEKVRGIRKLVLLCLVRTSSIMVRFL